jgi:hypothetical protein
VRQQRALLRVAELQRRQRSTRPALRLLLRRRRERSGIASSTLCLSFVLGSGHVLSRSRLRRVTRRQ